MRSMLWALACHRAVARTFGWYTVAALAAASYAAIVSLGLLVDAPAPIRPVVAKMLFAGFCTGFFLGLVLYGLAAYGRRTQPHKELSNPD